MIKEVINDNLQFLPLVINYIEWNDPILSFGGGNWSFSTFTGWRVVNNNKLDFTCRDENTDKRLNEFLNNHIIAIDIQSNHLLSDPVFVFSSGHKLEVFSEMYLEPWVFRSPNTIVYVGAPADNRYL